MKTLLAGRIPLPSFLVKVIWAGVVPTETSQSCLPHRRYELSEPGYKIVDGRRYEIDAGALDVLRLKCIFGKSCDKTCFPDSCVPNDNKPLSDSNDDGREKLT